MEIVGVAKDIRYTNLRDDIPEQAFIPYLGSHFLGSMTVYLRTTVDPNELMTSVRAKVRELDPTLPFTICGPRTHRSATRSRPSG